jgi:hypothetical protein
MTGKHTRRAGAAPRTLQTAAFSCRKAQFQGRSREASMMAMTCKRPCAYDGAPVRGRAMAGYAHAHAGRGPGGLAGQRWLGAGS